ncbi:MAG: LytTR family transcriptional regulator [Azospira oryzae]|nr:MAG: LytTR family transcriptional regulator [Azospira oryzae]
MNLIYSFDNHTLYRGDAEILISEVYRKDFL